MMDLSVTSAALEVWGAPLAESAVVLGAGFVLQRVLAFRPAAERHALWVTAFSGVGLLLGLSVQRLATLHSTLVWGDAFDAMVGIWALGAGIAMLPVVVGLVRLWAESRGLPRQVVSGCTTVYAPVATAYTWGWLRPVVVLPEGLQPRTAAFDTILAHERAHIERHDWLVSVLVRLVCAALWFQPLVWWAAKALHRTAEQATDDRVLRTGVLPSRYAGLLVQMASGGSDLGLGVARSDVSARVHAILAPRSRGIRRWPVLVLGWGLAVWAVPKLVVASPWRLTTLSPGCAPMSPLDAAEEQP